MRKELRKRNEERATFFGTFTRTGTKTGWKGRQETTILLTDIRDATGNSVCDHLWFNYTKSFAKICPMQPGATLRFDARVKEYIKGYFGYREDVYRPMETDYKLSHPTKVAIVVNETV